MADDGTTVKTAIMMCGIMDAPRQLLRRRKDKVASWPRTKFVRWRGEDVYCGGYVFVHSANARGGCCWEGLAGTL